MNEKVLAADPPACCTGPIRPRDRIVASARALFHKHGIRSVGVDSIAETAGTNKMTLYRHFGSKDDLIIECLQKAADESEAIWRELEAAHPDDPMSQLHGWIRLGAECLTRDMRGCDLANAAVELPETEHPARRLIEACKKAHHDRLVILCRKAGVAQAELLADTLVLLFEGARVSQQSAGAEGPCGKFLRMSEAVITAFTSGDHADPGRLS